MEILRSVFAYAGSCAGAECHTWLSYPSLDWAPLHLAAMQVSAHLAALRIVRDRQIWQNDWGAVWVGIPDNTKRLHLVRMKSKRETRALCSGFGHVLRISCSNKPSPVVAQA